MQAVLWLMSAYIWAYHCSLVSESCGNGVLDKGEECDGADVGGTTCKKLGLPAGLVTCTVKCKLNTSTCLDEYEVPLQDYWTSSESNFGGMTDASQALQTATFMHTDPSHHDPWWKIELPEPIILSKVTFNNRPDCCQHRFRGISLILKRSDAKFEWKLKLPDGLPKYSIPIKERRPVDTVTLQKNDKCSGQDCALHFNGFKLYRKGEWRLPKKWVAPQDISEKYHSENELPSECPQTCMMVNLGNFGRMNNQIIALANALSIAIAKRYTIVTDHFWNGPGTTPTRVSHVFDVSWLRRFTCVLYKEDFPILPNCIPGVWMFSRLPHSGEAGNYFYVSKNLLADDTERVLNATLGLRKHKTTKRLRTAASLLRPLFALRFAPWLYTILDYLPETYHGVHLRQQMTRFYNNSELRRDEPHCEDYLKRQSKYLEDSPGMCFMKEDYIRSRLKKHGRQLDGKNIVIISQDGPMHHKSPFIKTLWDYVPESSSVSKNAKQDPVLRLMAEMFMLVHSEIFMGNSMSSVSINVCGMRASLGRRCDNMISCSVQSGFHFPLPCSREFTGISKIWAIR